MAGVVWSDPFRGASNLAGRSNVRTIVATKFYHPRETDLRESWECRAGQHSVKANVDILVWNFFFGCSNTPGSKRTACQEGMCSESSEPLAGRLGAPAQRRHRV